MHNLQFLEQTKPTYKSSTMKKQDNKKQSLKVEYKFLNEIRKENQNNWIDSRSNTFGKINLY